MIGLLSQYVGSDVRKMVWVLFGAVAFVLLIACANVANLQLSQGATREREIAIRNAVGATRVRIVRQLLTENLLLLGIAGMVGVMLASWAFPLLWMAVPQHTSFFNRAHDVGIEMNSRALLFAVLLCVLSCVLCGLLPARRTSQFTRTAGTSGGTGHIRGALIGLELALCFVLLAGAGLMMQSLVRLLDTDVGFRTEHLLTMKVSLAGAKYAAGESQATFYDRALHGLESVPGVISAAAIVELPLTRSWTRNGFKIPATHPREGVAVYHAISPGYFRTMGIPLLSGRDFIAGDTPRSPLVGVINLAMARKYWPKENPIGSSIIAYRAETVSTAKGSVVEFRPREVEIVGIVGDVRQQALEAPPVPEMFMPQMQWPSKEMTLVLRTALEPSRLISAATKEMWRVDADQPVTDIRTMGQLISAEAAGRRFVLELLGTFAAIALVLAAVGTYGVVAYSTRQRTHEIGIRMALGARWQQILSLFVKQAAWWLLIGIAIGLGGAVVLTRLLAAYLYAVAPTDPMTLSAVALLLLVVALLAVYIPARRATKVDPTVALRYE